MHPVARLLTLPIRVWQIALRPLFAPACRFSPGCSDYALDALRLHGPVRGLGLAAWRVLRCNPWSAGGSDPVPCPSPHSRVP